MATLNYGHNCVAYILRENYSYDLTRRLRFLWLLLRIRQRQDWLISNGRQRRLYEFLVISFASVAPLLYYRN